MDVIVTVAEFKRYLKVRGYAEKTIESYGWGVDRFKDYLLSLDITDLRKVNHRVVLDYQAKINRDGGAVETRALKIRVVKRLFEYLTGANRLLINPTEGIVETNREKRTIGTVLTINEMKALLSQPNLSLPTQIRDRAIMEVLYSTGIRINELLCLQVYDADLKDQVLFIRKGKGKRQRVVPLGTIAVCYLKEYLEKVRPRHAKKKPKERTLFLSLTGLPVTWNTVRIKIIDYRKQASIEKSVSPHTFRRTCATHMLQQGADIRYIQKLLGHKYLRTTQAYTKVIPVEVKKTHTKTHPNREKEEDED